MSKSSPREHLGFFIFLLSSVIFLASVIFVFLTTGASQTRTASIWKTFSSQNHNLSFSYPPDWSIRESDSEISIQQPDSPYGFTVIIIKNITDRDKFIKSLEKNQTYAVEPDSSIPIGKLDTLALIDYTATHIQYMLYATSGDRLIDIVFLSDDPERTKTIARVLSTFVFPDEK